jgi:opacity protein-like surface antigen
MLLAVVSLTMLRAENQIGVSAGAGPAFPIRGIKRMFAVGYGGTGSIDILLNDNISILVRGGYYRWQFNSDRVNASVSAMGGATGFDVTGPFQAIPLMIGGRLTFDGAFLRPYFGLSGGACFLHWRIAGSTTAPGAPFPSGELSSTWTEPAMSVDAGFKFVLSPGLTLDIGGVYTAFSNADDRMDPSEFLGRKITPTNTATFVGVQAGLNVAF